MRHHSYKYNSTLLTGTYFKHSLIYVDKTFLIASDLKPNLVPQKD